MLSVNYLFCSEETFDPPLVYGEPPNLTEISPKKAFTQQKCKTKNEEVVKFFGNHWRCSFRDKLE